MFVPPPLFEEECGQAPPAPKLFPELVFDPGDMSSLGDSKLWAMIADSSQIMYEGKTILVFVESKLQ